MPLLTLGIFSWRWLSLIWSTFAAIRKRMKEDGWFKLNKEEKEQD